MSETVTVGLHADEKKVAKRVGNWVLAAATDKADKYHIYYAVDGEQAFYIPNHLADWFSTRTKGGLNYPITRARGSKILPVIAEKFPEIERDDDMVTYHPETRKIKWMPKVPHYNKHALLALKDFLVSEEYKDAIRPTP